jgi:hypothetical protein
MTVKYIWLSVYNGYLVMKALIPSLKIRVDQKEIHWSSWIELLRKFSEGTFGILKGYWCEVKIRICLHGVELADDI